MLGSPHFGLSTGINNGLNSVFDQQKLEKMDPMQNQQCRVCGEPAAGFHFGAFTCEGCKSFFGRTCNNQSVIQECKNNYRCVVDKKNRTACKACRLRKCLMVGMSKSGSRYGRRSNWFKIHCLMQQGPQGPQQNGARDDGSPTLVPSSPLSPAWPKIENIEPSHSEQKDYSFASGSRSPSPSPLNTSSDSSKISTSPFKMDSILPMSPHKPHPTKPDTPEPRYTQPFPATPPLASLYGSAFTSPLSLMTNPAAFPFYKLSPLLAHTSLLNNPFLASLSRNTHLDLIHEHRELLAKFAHPAAPPSPVSPPPRAPSPLISHDSPIDLSFKISTSVRPLAPSVSPSPSHPPRHEGEGVATDLSEKADTNRNLLHAANFEDRRDALDLTVSSWPQNKTTRL